MPQALFMQKTTQGSRLVWGGTSKGQTKLVHFSRADTEPAASCRFGKGEGRGWSPRMVWGHAHHSRPSAWAIQEGHEAAPMLVPLPPAAAALSPDMHSQHRPSCCCCQGFLPATGECRGDSLAIERCQGPQQVMSPKTSLSCFQLQAWWRGTMVRRYLGPHQALRTFLEKQRSAQQEKEGKAEAKRRTR